MKDERTNVDEQRQDEVELTSEELEEASGGFMIVPPGIFCDEPRPFDPAPQQPGPAGPGYFTRD